MFSISGCSIDQPSSKPASTPAEPTEVVESKPAAETAKVTAPMRSSESDDTAQTMEGRATWYGPGLYGNKTASGEVLKARAFPTLNSAREGEL